jgi:Spy/CpxP family protein refolding chaperone
MRARSFVAVLALASAACGAGTIPDPKDAAQQYARAAQKGDTDAIYDMMTASAKKARSKDELKKIVDGERSELQEQSVAISAKDARIVATARLRFDDGEESALELRDGHFWVTAAGALPGGARTPEEALDQLRRVLARRSYQGLMRVLTPETRAMVERDMRGLVEGLERPDTLSPLVSGDSASVVVPGGHRVRMRRDGGVWRIEDFD